MPCDSARIGYVATVKLDARFPRRVSRTAFVSTVIRPAAALLLAVVLGSCAHISGKTVASKSAPNTLIATDGSICVVSQERFEKTEVGMKALCAWKGGHIPRPQRTPRE